MKKVMRSAYSKEYTDYVCVDALGKLYDPDFVTGHFGQLLKKHNLKQIQEWLGHSDIHYRQHLQPPRCRNESGHRRGDE